MRALLFAGLLAYLSVCGGMYLAQDQMIFKTQPMAADSVGLSQFADAQLIVERDGIPLHGWLLNPQRENLLVYYGGNAEEVSAQLASLNDIADHAALVINYRGFGLSQGQPSAEALVEDALWLLQKTASEHRYQRIVLLGRSLGSGVAMQVASQYPVDGVILATPFDSLSAVAQGLYPWLPVSLLLQHEFDSMAAVPAVQGPVQILAVEPDFVVPTHHARRLAAAFGDVAEFHLIPRATHLNIDSSAVYWSHIRSFVAALSNG